MVAMTVFLPTPKTRDVSREVGLIDLYGLKAVSVDKQTNHSIVA